ncbi:DUF4407 domain-containing protein [Aliifodinibius salicampi]|uniref:DUF4407 domain-containing protein n=1 Tax=Fodinibius salicampi TaxID=1920655 RepID=A0ABT3PVT2_9BACT|nr:hypothetical protein [Fodinibius salicampi]MCW9711953.1 DUF4407 domain-containing protein [Fodinibius salicampi]
MKAIKIGLSLIVFLVISQTAAVSQPLNVTKTFKKHINETVQEVKNEKNAEKKRAILDKSLNKMLTAIDKIKSKASLSAEELAMLRSYKSEIVEKSNQLDGRKNYDRIAGEDLDEFADYVQQDMEQADRVLTISLTTALLVVIILLLL